MDKDIKRIKFRSYKFAEQAGIEPSIYRKVFDGTVNANSLEDIYTVFNTQNVSGFKGHSLSMSDIVEIVRENGEGQCHFVDRIGYKTLDVDTSKCIGACN
jgi:hypothetical protein